MSQESCFEKLEQLIFDENRIVTCKIVSCEMKIHVNKAKQFLNDFYLTRKTDESASLSAYYFLAGQIDKDGVKCVKVIIAPEEKLDKFKSEFSELTSCHIYSVSTVRLKDECALYTTDIPYNRDSEQLQSYAAIRNQCVRTQIPTFKNILAADAISNGSKNQNIKESNGILNAFKSKTDNRVKPADDVKSPEKSKSELESGLISNDSKKSSVSKKNVKPNTLVSLWQQKEETTSVDRKIPKSDVKAKKETAKSVGKNNILNMFSKQAEKNALSGVKSSTSVFNQDPKTSNEIKETTTPTLTNSLPTKSVSQKRKSLSKRVSSKKSQNQNDSDSEEEVIPKKKKHRRICTFDDSDSESENEEIQDKAQRNVVNSPDEIFSQFVSDDSEEPIPPTPPVHNSVKVKGKVWKTVQKTFQDEDGFFVTKKEKELVSASEDSDEEPIKSKAKESTPKISPNKGIFTATKQSSLTSFFKQK